MIEFANRVRKLEASATLAIAAKAKEMKKNGVDVISLAAGEPDWDPPYEAKEASIAAIKDGNAHYTENSGLLELKQLLVKKLKEENNLEVTTKNIIINSGAKFSLYLALQALINEGDEVAVISPYWVSYIEQIKLAGGIPKVIPTSEEDGFKIDVEDLEKYLTARVKGLILNYPSNPTGVTYTEEELKYIGELAVKKDIFVLSDEIYEYFNYSGKHTSLASLSPKIFNNVITVNGFSKAYSMPGWRVGYAVAREDIVKKLDEIQSHSTSNPNTIAQMACIACLKESKSYVGKMVSEFKERRDYIVNALNSIHGIRCQIPGGAFYVFPNIQYYLAKEVGGIVPTNSIEFSSVLLEKAQVSVVPGSAFGLEGYIRLSYTQPVDRLKEAVKRIHSLLENR
jgi:aspartate aminotransferase